MAPASTPAGTLSAPAPIALMTQNSYGARFSQYRAPRVAADGDGFLVVWESRHGGGFARPPLYDVLATRVSAGSVDLRGGLRGRVG